MKSYGQQDYRKRLDRVFARYHGKTAIVDCISEKEQQRYSYRKLQKMTEHIGLVLEHSGIRPGERVAVLTRPSADTAVTLLALAYLGYTAVIPDVMLPTGEQNRLLRFSEPSAVITNDDLCSAIDGEIRAALPVFRMISGKTPMVRLNGESEQRRIPKLGGSRDVIAILFSSGTTGSVKGVEITYQSCFYALKAGDKYADYSRSSPHFLQILPLSHVAGFTMLHANLILGAEMGFVPELTAAGLTLGMKVYEPTHMIMIPKVYETIHRKMLAEIAKRPFPVRAAFRLSKGFVSAVRKRTGIRLRFLTKPFYSQALGRRIKILGCGAAPCSQETVDFFLDLGIDFLNAYGSTEAAFPITASSIRDKYPNKGTGNVHQFPFIDIRIENGEILVKSALLMHGYFRDPLSTRNAYTDDGYLKTGDLGYIDSEGYLYITGRRKETIQLSNGNKVSAYDVDSYYQGLCGDIRIACCGVPDDDSDTEHLVLFIETDEPDSRRIAQLKEKLRSSSETSGSLYRLADIICIPELPQTTLGKIQRYKLRQTAEEMAAGADIRESSEERTPPCIIRTGNYPAYTEEVCGIIRKYVSEDTAVTPDSLISEELLIDSITMFEICSELQTAYDTEFMDLLGNVRTVQDLADIVGSSCCSMVRNVNRSRFNVKDYPLPRGTSDRLLLKAFMSLSDKVYNIEAVGTEKLKRSGHYIFCPNHESHLDGLWVLTALRKRLDCIDLACLAKQEHLDNGVSRKMIRILGGIPTDRSGNPAPALEQAVNVIKRGDIQFLVHPEGTRTRNGAMGEFKKGVAGLSIETGVPLVPVFIKGAYQIYPADRALPRVYDFRGRKRLPLRIVFGEPICPQKDDTPDTLTERLRLAVEKLRDGSV